MPAYIPPHMQASARKPYTPRQMQTPAIVANVPPHTEQQTLATDELPARRGHYTVEKIRHQLGGLVNQRTLNGIDHLSFILLSVDQNPEWPLRIFCHSNLHLLPSTPPVVDAAISGKTSTSPQSINAINTSDKPSSPIAVFTQKPGKKTAFGFCGMYSVVAIDYLEPHTEALIKMLEVKFTLKRRRAPEDWRDSLEKRWAVITLQKEDLTSNPMFPMKPGLPFKGVTEMLQELRVKDEVKRKSEEQSEDTEIKEETITKRNTNEDEEHNKLEEAS